MAVFGLLFTVPLLLYCAVQTLRDARGRRWPLAAYGAAMVALLIWMTARLLDDPGY